MNLEDFQFSIEHLGVNLPQEEEAAKCVALMSTLFGLEQNPKNESATASFTGTQIEWMKSIGKGTHGHIAIGTCDLPKAKTYLETKGLTFDESSIKRTPQGDILVIYADMEIGGFAIHLLQK